MVSCESKDSQMKIYMIKTSFVNTERRKAQVVKIGIDLIILIFNIFEKRFIIRCFTHFFYFGLELVQYLCTIKKIAQIQPNCLTTTGLGVQNDEKAFEQIFKMA